MHDLLTLQPRALPDYWVAFVRSCLWTGHLRRPPGFALTRGDVFAIYCDCARHLRAEEAAA